MIYLSSTDIKFEHHSNGTIMFTYDGRLYKTNQNARISDTGKTYGASVEDEDGEWRGTVYWPITFEGPGVCDDESNMCDWNVFTVHLDI